ncbi:MAG: NepR family anti-sigma factor [Sphingomonadaceae bacterium]
MREKGLLTSSDDPVRARRSKPGKASRRTAGRKPTPRAARDDKSAENGDLGAALRSVYDRTLNEEVPPEMLDLLGKLD